MDRYRSVLHVVAEQPGATADEIGLTATVDDTKELLQQATAEDDVVCVDDCYWIVRKGEFAYDTYDHPEP